MYGAVLATRNVHNAYLNAHRHHHTNKSDKSDDVYIRLIRKAIEFKNQYKDEVSIQDLLTIKNKTGLVLDCSIRIKTGRETHFVFAEIQATFGDNTQNYTIKITPYVVVPREVSFLWICSKIRNVRVMVNDLTTDERTQLNSIKTL